MRKPEPPKPPAPDQSASPATPASPGVQPAAAAAAGKLTGLGQALRWLRERQGRKQYQVADRAGITKGMLSAYETGRQRPSLETLEKLLETLDCDLNDLHNAIQIVNGRPEALRAWQGWQGERRLRQAPPALAAGRNLGGAGDFGELPAAGNHHGWEVYPGSLPEASAIGEGAGPEATRAGGDASRRLYDVIGRAFPLPPEEEKALGQILQGFHDLIRYWHKTLAEIRSPGPAPG